MARRGPNTVDAALELWARWCFAGGGPISSGRTMLAQLIDNKGELLFGGSSGSSGPSDSLEIQIEAEVLRMFAADPLRADVLRLEFGAGWWQVAARRKIRGYDPRGVGQFEHADALGLTLRTYRRRLAEARHLIEVLLGTL